MMMIKAVHWSTTVYKDQRWLALGNSVVSTVDN
jgi:hypothetical protein